MRKIPCSIKLVMITCLLVTVGAITPAGAANLNVTASAPDVLNGTDGLCALREAITNINDGANTYADCTPIPGTFYGTNDTISLPGGTYTNAIAGTGEDMNATGDLDITKSVIITGAGAASTIIDGNFIDRVFHVDALAGGITVTISRVTVRNGSVLLSGGGIFNKGMLTVNDSTISGNSTSASGGGIRNLNTLTIDRSTISGNTAGGIGGGIDNFGSGTALTITNSTISGNTAGNSGGGIASSGGATITGSTISGNAASLGSGGGISNNNSAFTIDRSTISGNSAGNSGGGLWNNATLTVTNSTISGNIAGISGGGVSNPSGVTHVTNSSIVTNSANSGGGIEVSATVVLKNTIVANQAAGGDCNAAVSSSLSDLDSDGSCGVGALSNQNPLLGPLANNGGSTLTHALLPGSPAIDAGDATICTSAPVNSFDQRGIGRPQGAGCDIGAFELVPPAACIQSGYVPRVTVKPGSQNSTIFLRTSSLASNFKRFTTTDTKLIKAAVKSLPGRTFVKIKGNADCTTATSGGAVQFVIVAP